MAKQPVKVKLFYSGAWQDHTADALIGEALGGQDITITHGRANEQEQAPPCQCGLTFKGHRFNPNNPTSDLYGLIGRNTPLRVELGTEHLGAVNSSATDTTAQVAPSITVPATPGEGIMFSAWMCPDGAATYTLPGTMSGGWEVADTRISMRVGRQLISASGATGTRTGTCSATEDYVALSVFIPGPTSDPTGSLDTAAGVATIDGTAGDWWLVIAGFSSDPATDAAVELRPPAAPWDTDGGGWIVLADTRSFQVADAEAEHLRMIAWIKQVRTTSSTHTVTLPPMATVDQQLMGVKRLPGAGVEAWSIRFNGEVASWTPKQSLGGPNIEPLQWVEVTAAGITRRLEQGADPLEDTVRRFVDQNRDQCIGYWPLSDPDGSTVALSGIGGASMKSGTVGQLSFSAPQFGQGEFPEWMPRGILTSGTVGQIIAPVDTDVTGGWVADFRYRAPHPSTWDGDLPQQTNLIVNDKNGVVWALLIRPVDDFVTLFINNAGDDEGTDLAMPEALVDGQPHHIRIRAFEGSGTSATLFVDIDGVALGFVTHTNIGSTAIQPPGSTSLEWTTTGVGVLPVALAQLALFVEPVPGLVGSAGAFTAYAGHALETTAERVLRLCDEEAVPLATVGDPALSVPSGPQYPDGFLTILAEAADTGQAMHGDAREIAAVRHRTLASLYNQTPVLELDYDAKEVAPPLDPVIDDQQTRNDVTVTGRTGGESRATLDTGPLSTQAPPNGVGRVRASYTANVMSPALLGDQAGWRLHWGTIGGVRFPQITVDLDASPALADAAGRVMSGDRITADNLPATITADLASLLCQGYTEVIGSHRRKITFNCSPYEPYQVGEVGHADYGVLQSDSAITAEALDTTETGIDINAGAGPDWVHEAGVDYDVEFGGEKVTVTAVGAMAGTFPNRTCTLTVTRSVNGVVKSHVSGTPIRFADRAYIGL
jgi:hypothetical protein